MTFIRAVFALFPLSIQKDICQQCLRIQTLGSKMVRINALKTLNEFCRGTVRNAQKLALVRIKSENEDELDLDELKDRVAEFKLPALPLELIAKLIIALRELRPSQSDRQVCSAWLEVLHS